MEYFGYGLAGLWSLGCFGLPLWGAWHFSFGLEKYDREYGMSAALLLLIWPLGCFMAFLPWMAMDAAASPNLETLKKAEWACSESHTETRRGAVSTGKITIPTTTHLTVCDQYNRIGDGA